MFEIGGVPYSLRDGELFDSENCLLPLRAKSAAVLAVLLAEPGRIFSKDFLAREVWRGLIATDESISQCISDIRRAFGDQDHTIVETFPKRGYRINAVAAAKAAPEYTPPKRSMFLIVTALVLIASAFALTQLFWPSANAISPATMMVPTRDAIAVLPFDSVNGTASDAFLSAGLAEDLIIGLSDLSALRVVPMARSFATNRALSKPKDVATELDARYLVYGRIQHGHDALLVSVQLVDSREDINVWAGTYELKRQDLLTYHASVLGDIVQALSLSLTEREESRVKASDTTSSEAYEEILKGRAAVSAFTLETSRAAERHFRTAIQFDPNYARAYAQLAATYAIRFENAWSVLNVADEEKAVFFANKAVEIDPELWLAHYSMGRILSTLSDSDLGVAERHLRRAISISPANDDARAYLAAVKNFSGNSQEGLSIIDAVIATHPSPPFWYYLTKGGAHMHLDQHGDAAAAFEKCLVQMPTSPYCLRYQIVNFGLMGQIDAADWAVEEYEALGQTASIEAIMGLMLDRHPNNLERVRNGLVASGLK